MYWQWSFLKTGCVPYQLEIVSTKMPIISVTMYFIFDLNTKLIDKCYFCNTLWHDNKL